MPRPRFDKLDPAKQEVILNAALEAFATHGFEGASYNQIIERAGVSKGAMYYYFDDKEDLYATVVRRELEGITEQFRSIPHVETVQEYWSMMREVTEGFMRFALLRPHTLGLFRGLLRMKKEGIHNPLIQEIHEIGNSFSRSFIDLGQRVGAVRADIEQELLVAIMSAVDEAGDMYLIEKEEGFTEQAMRDWGNTFLDLIRRILAPRVEFPEKSP